MENDDYPVFMEDKFKGLSYGEVLDLLPNCKNLDEEVEIYKKLVELSEKEIDELEDEEDFLELPTGEKIRCVPDYLDHYAAPMDNLSQIYVKRKEYAKALPLLEQVLPIYRTLEIFYPDYTYQRVYATELMVECLKELGKKNLATLYDYELKLLKQNLKEAFAVR